MPRTVTELQVFVASPSDVQRERELLASVIDELNRNWSSTLGVHLRLLRWETDVHPAFGDDPQVLINDQIGDDYDVFIGILWSRFGTPTPRSESGTFEEFERALARRRAGSSAPEIMVYFKDSPIAPTRINPAQLAKIQEFRTSLPGLGGLYSEFSDESGFESALRAHLAAVARKFAAQPHDSSKTTAIVEECCSDDEDFGYLDFIESYEARMSDMSAILSTITEATERMGDDFNRRTDEMKSFVGAGQQNDVKGAKRIIKRAAEDMNAYGRNLEAQLPLLTSARDESFTSLTKALAFYGQFGEVDSTQLESLRSGLAGFKGAAQDAREGLGTFRETIASMSRMTSDLNKAKKYVVRNLDEMDAEIERAQSASSSILDSIDQMLET